MFGCGLAAELRHVLGGGTLLALHDVELDTLTFAERLESAALNRRVMNEAILLSILRRDEAEALRIVEPLYGACRTHSPSPWCDVLCWECGEAVPTDTTFFVNSSSR